MPVILEVILHGGWRCVLVAMVAVAGILSASLPSMRSRFVPLIALSLFLGLLLSVELIASGLVSATNAESPGGVEVALVGATVEGLGPLVISLVGAVIACVSQVVKGMDVTGGRETTKSGTVATTSGR